MCIYESYQKQIVALKYMHINVDVKADISTQY